MPSYQYIYKNSHCGDTTILWQYYLYNGFPYTGKMASFYWNGLQGIKRQADGSRYSMVWWPEASEIASYSSPNIEMIDRQGTVRIIWDLAGVSPAVLLRHLSNFKEIHHSLIESINTSIKRFISIFHYNACEHRLLEARSALAAVVQFAYQGYISTIVFQ